jgi:hypothetical protein
LIFEFDFEFGFFLFDLALGSNFLALPTRNQATQDFGRARSKSKAADKSVRPTRAV